MSRLPLVIRVEWRLRIVTKIRDSVGRVTGRIAEHTPHAARHHALHGDRRTACTVHDHRPRPLSTAVRLARVCPLTTLPPHASRPELREHEPWVVDLEIAHTRKHRARQDSGPEGLSRSIIAHALSGSRDQPPEDMAVCASSSRPTTTTTTRRPPSSRRPAASCSGRNRRSDDWCRKAIPPTPRAG